VGFVATRVDSDDTDTSLLGLHVGGSLGLRAFAARGFSIDPALNVGWTTLSGGLPSHLTEVPMKVNEALAPATLDCMAAPPLHPKRRSASVHLLSKVTAAWDSSIRAPASAYVAPLLSLPPLLSSPAPPGVAPVPSPAAEGLRGASPPSPPPPQEITRAASNNAA
jgi:hypothetical protein